MPELVARGVTRVFGGVRAVDGIDLRVPRGSAVGVIGANGAGKSTLLDCLSGHQPLSAGAVLLDGADVSREPPELRVHRGVARTFQRLEVFASLTVEEHLQVALDHRRPRPPRHVAHAEIAGALERFSLAALARSPVQALPSGVLRRVELARAVCTGASLLLLDEPASGLEPAERDELVAHLRALVAAGRTVVVVEHDVPLLLRLADRLVVLDQGRVLADGAPADVLADPAVLATYVGTTA